MMPPGNDAPGKRWKLSSRTTTTKIRTPIWSCRRRFPNFKTTWTGHRTAAAPRRNPNAAKGRNTTGPSIGKISHSCWRRTKCSDRTGRTTLRLQPSRRSCPNVISARFVDFLRAIPARLVERGTALCAVWEPIRTLGASSGLRS